VVFEHEGVFIHSSQDESEDQDLISGFLRIVDKVWWLSVIMLFIKRVCFSRIVMIPLSFTLTGST